MKKKTAKSKNLYVIGWLYNRDKTITYEDYNYFFSDLYSCNDITIFEDVKKLIKYKNNNSKLKIYRLVEIKEK